MSFIAQRTFWKPTPQIRWFSVNKVREPRGVLEAVIGPARCVLSTTKRQCKNFSRPLERACAR